MARSIFDRSSYTTPLPFYKNSVFSYDMIQAGLSVLRDKGVVSKEEGEMLSSLPKQKRVVEVGKICQNNDEITKILEDGIKDAVFEFCQENEIREEDIISLKKDAIYCIKAARVLKFGDFIKWQEQSRYHCFYCFRGIEVYYNLSDDILDIKGMTSQSRELHGAYFTPMLKSMMKTSIGVNKQAQLLFFKNLRRSYLNFECPVECYREFTRDSKFSLSVNIAGLTVYSDFYVPEITDISFNYKNVIIPLISSIL